jgi:hypothetical protein
VSDQRFYLTTNRYFLFHNPLKNFHYQSFSKQLCSLSDIGQGPTYSKYTLEYLIVCLLADQSDNQQILLNGGSIKLPLNV